MRSAGPGGHTLLSELSVGNHQSFARSISGFSTQLKPYGFLEIEMFIDSTKCFWENLNSSSLNIIYYFLIFDNENISIILIPIMSEDNLQYCQLQRIQDQNEILQKLLF